MKKGCAAGALLLVLSLAGYGCGGGGTTTTATGITTVDGMPRATSPVVSDASAMVAGKALSKDATTGILMRTLGDPDNTFTAGQSMPACEAANHLREVLNGAAQADMILCYVQNIVASDTTGQLPTIYDGSYHIFGLTITGEEQGQTPDHIKMKIVKTGDNITEFEMFACSSGTQVEYLHQTISGSAFAMTSKGYHQDASGSGRHQVGVSGTLNSSGYYTAKEISQKNSGTWEGNTYWNEATVNQYVDSITYDGYDTGHYTDPNTGYDGSYTNRVYAQAQLIDPNASASNTSYDIGLIALGDGAAHSVMANLWAEGQLWSEDVTQGWLGDTKEQDDTVSWYANVTGVTPPEAGTAPTIEFTGDEIYGCDGAEEVAVTGDQTTMDAACQRFQLGWDWINCYELIQPGQ